MSVKTSLRQSVRLVVFISKLATDFFVGDRCLPSGVIKHGWLENTLSIGDLPIDNPIFSGFPIATFDYWRVDMLCICMILSVCLHKHVHISESYESLWKTLASEILEIDTNQIKDFNARWESYPINIY